MDDIAKEALNEMRSALKQDRLSKIRARREEARYLELYEEYYGESKGELIEDLIEHYDEVSEEDFKIICENFLKEDGCEGKEG